MAESRVAVGAPLPRYLQDSMLGDRAFSSVEGSVKAKLMVLEMLSYMEEVNGDCACYGRTINRTSKQQSLT